eukprot:TRINITY_DN6565_c0_g2_i2.p1 TRINITY_DN6565_c0_g2~~TRINITY_DN6565_c0_g2_i2.p1  ORF type:complete len:312 (+),score=112.14 TRINITY_DN6565_c0_g2_i2:75-1010(+)
MAGGYQLGFQLTPVTDAGQLDTSGDWKGGPHPVEEDPLWRLSNTNRDNGNKLTKDGKYEEAVSRYSEMIMQTRALEGEEDVIWTEDGREKVRLLRAAAYLNLSLCFLKMKQWQHAVNTATRALQGDKDPVDPKEDVLDKEKKVKALFRRAQAQRDGFSNLDACVKDLEKAAELVPEDQPVQRELKAAKALLAKENKQADKKMAGFLKKKDGDAGIFSEKDRERDTSLPEMPKEPVKVSDGLWVVPKDEEKKVEDGELQIDYDELSREINELKEEKPEAFKELQEKMKTMMEEEVNQREKEITGEEAEKEKA